MSDKFKDIVPLAEWSGVKDRPLIIAGPCSAESEEQVVNTAKELAKYDVDIVRAGIWKPRTKPGTFEGVGTVGLKWLNTVQKEIGLKVGTEVANPLHVEEALKHNIDVLWIGARTTVNPFAVQELADALEGVDVPVLVKNPINPDLALWMGGLERFYNAGIRKLAAIHRGFSTFDKSKFRNIPMWQIAIELKRSLPQIPIINDPSHICGRRDLLFDISQKALDLDLDGIMVEVHQNPDEAWSDAQQQITPAEFGRMLSDLKIRNVSSDDVEFINQLEELRAKIDNADRELMEVLASRMALVEKIGEYKKENNVTTLQVSRWNQILEDRKDKGKKMNLQEDFITEIFKLIHDESIRKQREVMKGADVKA